MKKFIIYIIGVLLTILVLLLIVDFSYTFIYKNATPRTKFQYLRSFKNQKINYIFLGSSRVDSDIVTLLIEDKTKKKALNLGFEYAHLGDVYYLIQLLNKYNIKSDSLFIQIDYMFNENKGFSNNLPYEMTPFIRDNSVTEEYLLNYVGKNWSNYYVPYVRYCTNEQKIGFRNIVANISKKKTDIKKNKGYSPLQGIEKKGNGHRSLPVSISSVNIFFEKIKKYGKDNNIKIVFFCAPFCKHTKHLDYISKLKIKIPELNDFSRVINDDKMFVNCYHLNDKGAKVFSEIFVNKIFKINKK